MDARKSLIPVVLLIFALALAPAALAKSDAVPASGSRTWTNDG
jgi:hypothetical protein